MYYQSDLMDGNFRNPILFADYSDPDVIRVGDTYYLTASSFHYTPGLPILISKDLINWKLVNYALDRVCEAPGVGRPHEDSEAIEKRFQKPCHSEGVWAPTIRYHEGMFFIFYGMPDEGIYMVRAKDPLGKWEEPVCLLPGKGLIDSCPFWDEDGRAYIVHAYAKSRIGFKSILGIFEMSPDGTRAISEDKFIFDGNDPAHPAITIEGPKVYKRDGFYYILAPAGGVRQGWQVALRSRNIEGPYEIRTVMDQGNSVINGPHQGGLVDTTDGEEWFLHFQDRGLFGRICHLQPVSWKDGWPVIGSDVTGRPSRRAASTMLDELESVVTTRPERFRLTARCSMMSGVSRCGVSRRPVPSTAAKRSPSPSSRSPSCAPDATTACSHLSAHGSMGSGCRPPKSCDSELWISLTVQPRRSRMRARYPFPAPYMGSTTTERGCAANARGSIASMRSSR